MYSLYSKTDKPTIFVPIYSKTENPVLFLCRQNKPCVFQNMIITYLFDIYFIFMLHKFFYFQLYNYNKKHIHVQDLVPIIIKIKIAKSKKWPKIPWNKSPRLKENKHSQYLDQTLPKYLCQIYDFMFIAEIVVKDCHVNETAE